MYYLAALEGANFWTALPSMLWVGLLVVILLLLYKPLSELVRQFVVRVRAGAPMKIGYVEVGAIRTEQNRVSTPISGSSAPESGFSLQSSDTLANEKTQGALELDQARDTFYKDTRRIMLVHRLFHSTKPGQVYDVLIYLVPRDGATLVEVTGVEYFFGRYWGSQVFRSYDRSSGFPILTSAYGTFLCCARVSFNDGQQQLFFRHIDFEMGAYSPVLVNKEEST